MQDSGQYSISAKADIDEILAVQRLYSFGYCKNGRTGDNERTSEQFAEYLRKTNSKLLLKAGLNKTR